MNEDEKRVATMLLGMMTGEDPATIHTLVLTYDLLCGAIKKRLEAEAV
jgi:hypothetical protein